MRPINLLKILNRKEMKMKTKILILIVSILFINVLFAQKTQKSIQDYKSFPYTLKKANISIQNIQNKKSFDLNSHNMRAKSVNKNI